MKWFPTRVLIVLALLILAGPALATYPSTVVVRERIVVAPQPQTILRIEQPQTVLRVEQPACYSSSTLAVVDYPASVLRVQQVRQVRQVQQIQVQHVQQVQVQKVKAARQRQTIRSRSVTRIR